MISEYDTPGGIKMKLMIKEAAKQMGLKQFDIYGEKGLGITQPAHDYKIRHNSFSNAEIEFLVRRLPIKPEDFIYGKRTSIDFDIKM